MSIVKVTIACGLLILVFISRVAIPLAVSYSAAGLESTFLCFFNTFGEIYTLRTHYASLYALELIT